MHQSQKEPFQNKLTLSLLFPFLQPIHSFAFLLISLVSVDFKKKKKRLKKFTLHFKFTCVGVLPLCICLFTMYMQCLQRLGEGVRSPATGIIDACELPDLMLRTRRCPSTRETNPLSRLTISPVPTSLFSFLCIDYSQMLPVDTVACSDHFRVLFSPSSRDLHKEPSTLALPIGLIFFFIIAILNPITAETRI